ncbi:hypothetical protein FKB34_01780 [Glycocaulis profundi]|nr:hypothetical protein FKB34_01780 [Glycocaulis profundi]
MATWPSAVPPHMLREGYVITPPRLGERDDRERGPAFQRRRFTSGAWLISGIFYFTPPQLEAFEIFWEQDLLHGVRAFTGWPMPHNGRAGRARFNAEEVWTAERTGGGNYRLAMEEIEFWPVPRGS